MANGVLQREDDARVQCWRLVRGRGNALDPETLQALIDAFEEARDDPRPVILCARGRSFCTGLDLQAAATADRAAMAHLMERFHRALAACFLHPRPVVAALGGHALAGGALLALACDRRVMADGDRRFGIHGVHLGVSYPQVAVEILRYQLPRPVVEELLYAGRIFPAAMAHQWGLVDQLVAVEIGDEGEAVAEKVEEAARREAVALQAMGPESFAELKRSLRAQAARRLWPYDGKGAEAWLDQWFRPCTQERLRQALDALARGRGEKPAGGIL